MKKRLFLLPAVAAFALSGCFLDDLFGGDKGAKALDDLGANVLREYNGYKVATKVKDGGEYLLGVYRVNEDIIRFANGDYHRDSAGFYPFYMNTVASTTEGAATVKVKFVTKTEFSLQVSAPGQVWDGKYIGFYPSKAVKNYVISLALLDDPEQKTYNTIPNHQNPSSEQVNCYGLFTFFDYYETLPVCAPGITMMHPQTDEEEVPKFMGTGHNADVEKGKPDYTSIDAKSWEAATDPATYDLVHLYEKA